MIFANLLGETPGRKKKEDEFIAGTWFEKFSIEDKMNLLNKVADTGTPVPMAYWTSACVQKGIKVIQDNLLKFVKNDTDYLGLKVGIEKILSEPDIIWHLYF